MSKHQLLTMLLLLIGGIVNATDIHVNPGGSIQTAVSSAASGDRVIIHAGTYSQVVSMGNKTNLTITSAGDGEVIVEGNGTDGSTFWIENSSSITISYLTIKNTRKLVWSTGITVIGSGSNIQIIGNKVTDVSYRSGAYDATDNPDNNNAHFQGVNAISVVGNNASTSYSNIVIKDNEVSYCMTGWSEAIALKGNIDGFNVENNKVHHITNIGIDAFGLGTYPSITSNNQARNGSIKKNEVYNCICNYTDNGGIYIDGGLSITVTNNKVYSNKYGITLGCENQMVKPDGATEFIEIRNNLVYNNSRAGIMVGTGGDDDGQQGITRNCKVTGNTFLKNATGDQWAGEFVLQNAHNIEFYNNIFQGLLGRIGTINNGSLTNTFGYNVIYAGTGVTVDFSKQTGTSTWTSQTLAQFKTDMSDNSSTSQDPKLVNANVGTLDAHLQSTSPCINTGKPGFATLTGEIDLDGQSRIFGTTIDIGVDEYGSTGTVSVTAVSVSPTSASIATSATQQLSATITPSNATNQTKTWSSSNTAVATVNTSGLVTGVAAGTATMTVTTQDGNFTATCVITVTSSAVSVSSVSVSPTTASIGIGGIQQITATISPSNATNQNKTWSSSNTAVATVNTSGLVTGVAAGTATITVTTQDGSKTATSTITVTSSTVAVSSVSVSPTSASIAAGATQQLTATISPSNATNQNKTWTSSNTSIATVNTSGLVTGVAAGTATITVTTQDGSKTATSSITVTSSGSLPSPWVTANIGAVGATGSASYSSGTFSVIGSGLDIYGDTDEFRYVYQSLNGNGEIIARVASLTNTDGWAKAGVMIRENLTANSNHALCAITPSNGAIYQRHLATGNITNQTQVTGVTAPRWIRVVRAGNVFTAYYSSNGTSWTQIATETISMATNVYIGLAVTSHNDGTLCTGSFDGVTTSTGSVSVTGVSVSPTSASIAVGATQQLTATISPANATNQTKTWTSNNTGIATVNTAGLVTAVAAGTATITVTTQDGNFIATSAFTVTSSTVAVSSVSMSPTSTSVTVGATQQLTATISPSNATNQNKTWSSSNTAVATVNTSGLVTGVAAGTATITVTTQDGNKTATSSITVTSGGAASITIDGSLSDWAGLPTIATATSQTALSLKVFDNGTYLYFGISGSGLGPHHQILINSDNNTSTGNQHWAFPSSGAEYYIQDGSLAPYSTYTQVGTATYSASATVIEARIAKSLFSSLSNTITVAFVDINSGWSLVSTLGFSSYTMSSSGRFDVTTETNLESEISDIAYPNPAGNNAVNIQYSIKEKTPVRIHVTDMRGLKVYSADLGKKESGIHTHKVETSAFEKGIYLIKIEKGIKANFIKIIVN